MGMKLSNVDTWGPIEASIVARARLMNLAEEHNGNVLFDDEAVTQKIIQRADKLNDKVTKDPSLKPFLDLHVREGLRLQELDKRFKHHYDASKREALLLANAATVAEKRRIRRRKRRHDRKAFILHVECEATWLTYMALSEACLNAKPIRKLKLKRGQIVLTPAEFAELSKKSDLGGTNAEK
ncbi:MAG: hypothetical protein H6507_07280 [Calditrichaeota bacterium]|nr:hypothetical protein [Calditrichota bacterium]